MIDWSAVQRTYLSTCVIMKEFRYSLDMYGPPISLPMCMYDYDPDNYYIRGFGS